MFKKNTNYFYAVRISISVAVLSEILIQIAYLFYELCKKTKVAVFFLNTVYMSHSFIFNLFVFYHLIMHVYFFFCPRCVLSSV